MKSFKEQLDEFINDPHVRNSWLGSETAEVYVRKGRRYINGSCVTCLDIANINVDENKRGQGFFKNLVSILKTFQFDCLFVENVFNEKLCDHLQRTGWTKIDNCGVPSYYIKVNNEAML